MKRDVMVVFTDLVYQLGDGIKAGNLFSGRITKHAQHVHRGTHEQLTHEILVKLCYGSAPTSKDYQVILCKVHVVTSVSDLWQILLACPLRRSIFVGFRAEL